MIINISVGEIMKKKKRLRIFPILLIIGIGIFIYTNSLNVNLDNLKNYVSRNLKLMELTRTAEKQLDLKFEDELDIYQMTMFIEKKQDKFILRFVNNFALIEKENIKKDETVIDELTYSAKCSTKSSDLNNLKCQYYSDDYDTNNLIKSLEK